MPFLADTDHIIRELAREVLAVVKLRAEGGSWFGFMNSVVDTPSVDDLLARKFAKLSDYRKLILRALLKLGAVSEKNARSAPQIAAELNGMSEPRLRGALSDLRSLGFVGGEKGQRGYWLTVDAASLLARPLLGVPDSVRD